MDFRYVALDSQGQTVSGLVDAQGEREAARQLRERDLTPIELAPAQAAAGPRRGALKASEQDKAIVVRELATLLGAGVPLAEAVESIATSHTDSGLGAAFDEVHRRLRNGESFSAALREAGLPWPDYVFPLVAAGEQTGRMAAALESAANQMEYQQRVRGEMRNALIYPAVLVVSGIAATLLIFIVVVPRFANILRSTRAQVPEISVWVLKTGVFVKDNLGWVALAAVLAAALLAMLFASRERRTRMLQALAGAPILGEWLTQTEIARWASMLGTLLENKVPILKAMELTEQGLRLPSMRGRLQQALREVRGGKKLAEALGGVQVLNVSALNLVRVGERSGELPAMLRALANLQENAARDKLKRFLILLEPAAIVLIGGVIGLIMVSVMLAITSMTTLPL